MYDRCKRLCKDFRDDCFIKNPRQVVCIADMVINKITGISALLQLLMKKETSPENLKLIEKADMEIKGLVDWIRFLELAGDIREFIKARPEERPDEKRSEPRFPVTDTLRDIMKMSVQVDDKNSDVEIINISNKGILFRSRQEFEPGERILSTLKFIKNPIRERVFYLTVRHSTKKGEHFLTGAEVDRDEATYFSIFQSVYEYVEEMVFKNSLQDE